MLSNFFFLLIALTQMCFSSVRQLPSSMDHIWWCEPASPYAFKGPGIKNWKLAFLFHNLMYKTCILFQPWCYSIFYKNSRIIMNPKFIPSIQKIRYPTKQLYIQVQQVVSSNPDWSPLRRIIESTGLFNKAAFHN